MISHSRINLTVIRFVPKATSDVEGAATTSSSDDGVLMALPSLRTTSSETDNTFLADFYDRCLFASLFLSLICLFLVLCLVSSS